GDRRPDRLARHPSPSESPPESCDRDESPEDCRGVLLPTHSGQILLDARAAVDAVFNQAELLEAHAPPPRGSSMDHVVFDHEPPANLTTMVMAFGGWIDAGQAATGALRHLVRHLSATRLARIDPEQFLVFTQERPNVRMRADESREIDWPQSEFFAFPPGDGREGLLLFSGGEPHQRWRTYTKAFLDVAERCGVRRIVSLGALLAGAPHTRPIRVTGRCTDPTWRSVLEA